MAEAEAAVEEEASLPDVDATALAAWPRAEGRPRLPALSLNSAEGLRSGFWGGDGVSNGPGELGGHLDTEGGSRGGRSCRPRVPSRVQRRAMLWLILVLDARSA